MSIKTKKVLHVQGFSA